MAPPGGPAPRHTERRRGGGLGGGPRHGVGGWGRRPPARLGAGGARGPGRAPGATRGKSCPGNPRTPPEKPPGPLPGASPLGSVQARSGKSGIGCGQDPFAIRCRSRSISTDPGGATRGGHSSESSDRFGFSPVAAGPLLVAAPAEAGRGAPGGCPSRPAGIPQRGPHQPPVHSPPPPLRSPARAAHHSGSLLKQPGGKRGPRCSGGRPQLVPAAGTARPAAPRRPHRQLQYCCGSSPGRHLGAPGRLSLLRAPGTGSGASRRRHGSHPAADPLRSAPPPPARRPPRQSEPNRGYFEGSPPPPPPPRSASAGTSE
nr:basic proline-rich protein-like [Anser cygnoides]